MAKRKTDNPLIHSGMSAIIKIVFIGVLISFLAFVYIMNDADNVPMSKIEKAKDKRRSPIYQKFLEF